jgi:SAM-dependent methyltransferase
LDHFDAVVGRNVLMYVADPAEVLRICADHLRPGGVMAFQEVEWSITERVDSMPSVAPLVQQAATWMIGGFRQARAEMQMGFKFPGIFLDAGLPLPQISLDGIAGTEADWVGYDFLTDALRDILPKLREYAILAEDLDATTYIKRMREEIIQQHSLFPMFFMAGAWIRKA